ncbi:GNAT family N-acetyltransferase [Vibrio tubiashii]|uniref:GCN5 family acetyltransferase n=1 Tax=Vibrio tubiashii ATCC 19109 TaxID=1051646 RepID=F9TAZ2_9VIBR|nr:GNAT family N-acetyltransferase [Vibrio tubiashii]AIW17020.1 GCN5 family acetyltransferase [Vibrio tubiashii ATCC 19109]EGU49569.1 GCN5-related N-acetyltransferase [Vibrio tubiashii ATCC 19109]EIF03770.1 N-acetyltransferase GCN5 [Vibrio tubiashii NCIMB 1337 = ATCC 19106]
MLNFVANVALAAKVETYMKITFKELENSDIHDLIEPMTKVFNDDAKQFQGKEAGGPPGYDDGSFLGKWGIDNPDSRAFTVCIDEKSVGAFIIWWNERGVSTLGNIFVDPKYQNRGIGLATWKYVESNFPTKKWCLETALFPNSSSIKNAPNMTNC